MKMTLKTSQKRRKVPSIVKGGSCPVVRRIRASRGVSKPKPSRIKTLKRKLWELCKQITRQRYGNICYTCGKTGLVGGNWQTGHFISSSVCSTELRYDLDNLRPQCYHCNINLSGNWIAFEAHLIIEKGQNYPDVLKALNKATKGQSFRADWYEEKIKHYQSLITKP